MNEDVYQVIAKNVIAAENIIQGERKVCHAPHRVEPDDPEGLRDVSDGRIAGNIAEIIKNKRIKQGTSVTYPGSQDEEDRNSCQQLITAMVEGFRGSFIYRLQQ